MIKQSLKTCYLGEIQLKNKYQLLLTNSRDVLHHSKLNVL